ncbi:MAG TPA: prephenate dehydrogenase/arogenate dehydrogenase family protein, partial [Clostridiales bacterium]|nr:prephenate dehydrogenase/arogenate dehydrogenase family protein [Clostridiales bacterium]
RSSRADLFEKACMVVVPKTFDDIVLYDRIKKVLEPAGFGKVSVTTAEKHDELIAFTSQMAHVVSNAFIKSPTAGEHKGFSAGSYKDLTRVAWLNPDMWTALFLENKDNLLKELDIFLRELQKYRDAIVDGDEKELHRLLEEGSRRKEEVDGA